jgi:hypothetical protein
MSQNRAYILKIYSQLNRYLQDHDREECGVWEDLIWFQGPVLD